MDGVKYVFFGHSFPAPTPSCQTVDPRLETGKTREKLTAEESATVPIASVIGHKQCFFGIPLSPSNLVCICLCSMSTCVDMMAVCCWTLSQHSRSQAAYSRRRRPRVVVVVVKAFPIPHSHSAPNSPIFFWWGGGGFKKIYRLVQRQPQSWLVPQTIRRLSYGSLTRYGSHCRGT